MYEPLIPLCPSASVVTILFGVLVVLLCINTNYLILRIPTVCLQIASTISDLRSTLSREGCRTVALMAVHLEGHFAPLVELFVPALLKQVGAVSTAVMTWAANKAMLVVLSTQETGFPKVLPILLEGCSSKAPGLRLRSLEYLMVCGALWATDAFDRYDCLSCYFRCLFLVLSIIFCVRLQVTLCCEGYP